MPWLEYLTWRRIGWLTAAFLTLLCVLELGLLAWVTAGLPGPLAGTAAVRDFAGLLGISLLGVAFTGVTAGWLAPMLTIVVAIVIRSGENEFLLLDWPARDGADRPAWLP